MVGLVSLLSNVLANVVAAEVVIHADVRRFIKNLAPHVFFWTCRPHDKTIKSIKESLDFGWAFLSEWWLALKVFVTSGVSIYIPPLGV